ncbi:asparagine synthase (glutamine-hydrolyzing) [Geomobilimonas luticola]|uniref:asparagine synthase (glutamine-hydrolyzing) n=1 Tax=Geomobilimonas luticola TaxID=1114878 RepID=A0ABS5SCY0_9BACT|nr:asparagine synthase (glutamine-hydrolyzing) [Geomobilimonas luticola]MBT0653030.1 asparagine synthase (glutamine-hydrolyzing) [Geomobilimonas luticola]
MCGIAGIIAPQASRYRDAIQKMTDSLSHRGPDGSGIHFFDACALGHRRLSVVDLETGRQPMLSQVSSVGITFNGEIYGYREIRATLTDYPFCTSSDTEVILALYEKYRHNCMAHVPGMFAFAVWDEARQELFCARDRFGEKPFYYAFGKGGEFIFASEIKAILASGLVKPVLNREALAHYLQYLYVHPLQTIYGNIHALPPAHSLRWRDERVSVERYWTLPKTVEKIAPAEAVERFRELFDRAVARQLVADVPVGAFLSGGLDSSTVVAVASRHQARIKTFSFGFEDSVSELPYARQVAEKYGTEHFELADKTADIGELLVAMQEVYDEPFADSSNIPTYLISKLASDHVKVVLTGDGADELLAGYLWYRPLLAMQKGGSSQLLRLALALSRFLRLKAPPSLIYRGLGEVYAKRYGSIAQAHSTQKQYFTDSELVVLGLKSSVNVPFPDGDRVSGSIDDALKLDIEGYMPGDILVKIDRASMANGLELRAPFLDVDFASFCISLPWSMKTDTEQDKRILRQGYADTWPPAVRSRNKQGFGAPVNYWLKHDSVRALKEKYLGKPDQRVYSIMPYGSMRDYIERDDYRTWILLVLSMWLERHNVETT